VASTEHCLDHVDLPCTVTNWLIIQTLGRQYNLSLSRENFNKIIESTMKIISNLLRLKPY